jgi:glycosyltransferase involved in cell wall biosynthesis
MQKTTFPFEILIHDDASTDGTVGIIRDYERKYPDLIKPIYQIENQYSQGRTISATYQFPRAKGKYIALCEGDDYWTDPLKLQKQVDFLEVNEDCSLCFHSAEFIYAKNPEKKISYIDLSEYRKILNFEMKHAILGGGGFMATNSMLFHREYILERPKWMDEAPVGDSPLMLFLASKGKMGFIDDVMSVYRVMTPNSWGSTMRDRQKSKKHHFAILKMWDDFDNWSNKKYHQFVVRKKLKNKLNYLIRSFRNILK